MPIERRPACSSTESAYIEGAVVRPPQDATEIKKARHGRHRHAPAIVMFRDHRTAFDPPTASTCERSYCITPAANHFPSGRTTSPRALILHSRLLVFVPPNRSASWSLRAV